MSGVSGSGLRAGAAVADITPGGLAGLNAMGGEFVGIHDRLAATALVLQNAADVVALVSADLLEFGVTTQLRARIAERTGIPAHAVLIAPTHSHNAPRAGRTPAGGLSRAASAESLAYTEELFDRLVNLVREAQEAAAPARLGVGRGRVDVNVNRDELRDGRWMLGQNPERPSDKGLTVLSFRSPAGEPIATVLGYAVHPTASLGTRLLSADVAGAATARVRAELGGAVLWLAGSLGDQAVRESLESHERAGERIDADAVFSLVEEQGRMIADEAVRVARAVDEWADDVAPRGAERTLDWPAKAGVDLPPDMRQEKLDRVPVRLTAVTLGEFALLGVGGEVTTAAAADILASSPATHPVVVSMANERLGYLADDEAFALGTFAARGCPVQPGWTAPAATALAEMVAGLTE